MNDQFQNVTEDFQKAGKANYDAALRSYGEVAKSFQAIGSQVTDYAKRSFEDATRAFEQLASAKSLEQALEIQSRYAKTAYDNWMAQASKIGELYASAAREAYKPVEQAVAKHTA